MFKHATVCRTNRVQQVLRNQWTDRNSDLNERNERLDSPDAIVQPTALSCTEDLNNNSANSFSSLINSNWLTTTRAPASCSSSPTPSLATGPAARLESLSSATSSTFNSPSKSSSSQTTAPPVLNRSAPESMIKIFAQTLSQEVEYVTLHLNAQTKSQQIIRALLKKFRLKHRDPNLFYLTLERWIRKDGLKFKSVMLLGDDACPLQLQQCCSNPPHNDIKFTLQMRTGALMKIFCSDVCSDTKYKCLSLSLQTTVEETIGLMLHCLNLIVECDSKENGNGNESTDQNIGATHEVNQHNRQANSPGSTGSSSSSVSSTSSSSGIESDMMNQSMRSPNTISINQQMVTHRLEASSRTSSITSISSASNVSNASSGQLFSEHYCLVIECENTNYKRVLESDDFLVEVYQGLLDEASEQQKQQSPSTRNEFKPPSGASSSSSMLTESIKRQTNQLDQWFVIKLKRRDNLGHHSVKFANPRQNMPLPPIPHSLAQFNNVNDLQFFVSTTHIEVNHHKRRISSNLANSANSAHPTTERNRTTTSNNNSGDDSCNRAMPTACSRPVNYHQKQMSAVVSSKPDKMPPPPETLVWLPPVTPRRRNLSNASSTFGQPQNGLSAGFSFNKRRYDPAQLAEDLDQLNFGAIERKRKTGSVPQSCTDDATSDTKSGSEPVIERTGAKDALIQVQSQIEMSE